jgi:hypothetical protein
LRVAAATGLGSSIDARICAVGDGRAALDMAIDTGQLPAGESFDILRATRSGYRSRSNSGRGRVPTSVPG